MHAWMNEWTNEWNNERNGWMKQCMACMHAFILWVMNASMNKSMNLRIWSSRTAPHAWVVFTIFRWNRVLATVSSLFCRPHSCPETDSFFIFLWNRAFAMFCALFVDNFCRSRPATAGTEALLRWPWRVFFFSSLNSRVVTLPNYLMMPWLTWGCGWHDDMVDMILKMLAMTIVLNSEVF